MRIQSQLSYWACRFSIQKLLGLLTLPELWDEKPASVDMCKLWTFTFPDPETRLDERKAMACWQKLADRLTKDGRKCVRVIEQSSKGFWHFHCVTPQFWPVVKIRHVSELCGFGRVNVKNVPLDKAHYIAKYVGKSLMSGNGRLRKWACIGFQGFKVTDVERVISSRVLVAQSYDSTLWEALEWHCDGITLHTVALRPAVNPQSPITKKMELKKHWLPAIAAALGRGEIIVLGEYRGSDVETKQFKAFDSGKVVGSVSNIMVTHHVEVGNGKSLDFRERLPDPVKDRADKTKLTAGEIKPPASRGDIVLVGVKNMSDQWGHDTTGITNLSAVGEPAGKP